MRHQRLLLFVFCLLTSLLSLDVIHSRPAVLLSLEDELRCNQNVLPLHSSHCTLNGDQTKDDSAPARETQQIATTATVWGKLGGPLSHYLAIESIQTFLRSLSRWASGVASEGEYEMSESLLPYITVAYFEGDTNITTWSIHTAMTWTASVEEPAKLTHLEERAHQDCVPPPESMKAAVVFFLPKGGGPNIVRNLQEGVRVKQSGLYLLLNAYRIASFELEVPDTAEAVATYPQLSSTSTTTAAPNEVTSTPVVIGAAACAAAGVIVVGGVFFVRKRLHPSERASMDGDSFDGCSESSETSVMRFWNDGETPKFVDWDEETSASFSPSRKLRLLSIRLFGKNASRTSPSSEDRQQKETESSDESPKPRKNSAFRRVSNLFYVGAPMDSSKQPTALTVIHSGEDNDLHSVIQPDLYPFFPSPRRAWTTEVACHSPLTHVIQEGEEETMENHQPSGASSVSATPDLQSGFFPVSGVDTYVVSSPGELPMSGWSLDGDD